MRLVADILWRNYIPAFLGMGRALGRIPCVVGNSVPLLGSLFPAEVPQRPSADLLAAMAASSPLRSRAASPRRTFSTFRSIIPRTLSQSLLSSNSPSPDFTSSPSSRQRSPSPVEMSALSTGAAGEQLDPTLYYFGRIGVTFTQDEPTDQEAVTFDCSGRTGLEFTTSQLEALLGLVSTRYRNPFFCWTARRLLIMIL